MDIQLIDLLKDITWSSISAPLVMGLFVALIMVLMLKPVLDLVFETIWNATHTTAPAPVDWPARSLATNLVTYTLCLLLSWWRMSSEWTGWGPVLILSILSLAVATVVYELVKNLLKVGGLDISKIFLRK